MPTLALKKVDDLDSAKNVAAKRTSLEGFRHEFIAYATAVFSKASISIYERSFNKFTEYVGDIPIAFVSQRHVDLFRARVGL